VVLKAALDHVSSFLVEDVAILVFNLRFHAVMPPTGAPVFPQGVQELDVLGVGHLGPVNPERIQVYGVGRPFIGCGLAVSVFAAHQELAIWHVEHHRLVSRAGPGHAWAVGGRSRSGLGTRTHEHHAEANGHQ